MFKPFHNGTLRNHSCLQKSIVKLKAKDKKNMFRYALKINFKHISNTFLPKELLPIRLQKIVTTILILQVLCMILTFLHIKLSIFLKTMQSQKYAIYLSFKPAKAWSEHF